jgi:hypothetical protein
MIQKHGARTEYLVFTCSGLGFRQDLIVQICRSIPASYVTVESEGRRDEAVLNTVQRKKIHKNPPVFSGPCVI